MLMSEKGNTQRRNSLLKDTWKRFKKNKMALIGVVIFSVILFLTIFADVLFSYDEVVIKPNYSETFTPPSPKHLLGTDELGRDVLARIVHGSRISLFISIASVSLGAVVGSMFGFVAGYFGGTVDNIIMRIMDVFLAIPNLILAIAIVAAFGTSTPNLILAIAISNLPRFSRIARSAVLSVRGSEFVEAAKACGSGDLRIIIEEIIPNSLAPVIVQYSLSLAGAILTISSLSFIGLGVKPPQPEWGAMLTNGRQYFRAAGYLIVFPGLAIAITSLSINLIGDGLRDALDPKLKQ